MKINKLTHRKLNDFIDMVNDEIKHSGKAEAREILDSIITDMKDGTLKADVESLPYYEAVKSLLFDPITIEIKRDMIENYKMEKEFFSIIESGRGDVTIQESMKLAYFWVFGGRNEC